MDAGLLLLGTIGGLFIWAVAESKIFGSWLQGYILASFFVVSIIFLIMGASGN